MQLMIKGKGIEVNEALRTYVEKKIGRLARFLDHITDIQVELSVEPTRSATDRQVVQVTLNTKGAILRAEEKSADMFATVDLVSEKMERQIMRFKERHFHREKIAAGRAGQVSPKATPVEPLTEEEEVESESEAEKPRIVRVKRFAVKPMSPEEAVEQMELLGHDFYVFHNGQTNSVNVVYCRHDGTYGLLVPELL